MGPEKLKPNDLKIEDFSSLQKTTEELIAKREKSQQRKLNKEFNLKKISPRTHQRKNLELEQWVVKEKEEVKKTKKKFEKEWQKTRYLEQQYDQIRRILVGENNTNGMISSSSRIHYGGGSSHNVGDALLTDEHRSRDGGSSRRPGVLALIYDKDNQMSQPNAI